MAAGGLAGCGADLIDSEHARRISKERVALLKRQPPPNCEYRTARLDESAKRQTDGSPPSSDLSSDAAMRMKLDYERQCYRHAEMIARARLTSLQGAVQDKVKAGKRDQTGNP